MQELIKKHAEKFRFAVIGGISTVIDFGVLFVLVGIGFQPIPSNFVSTFLASIFNFFAHKSFTYKDETKTSARHIISYIIVTIGALWLLQPIVLYLNDIMFKNWGMASNISNWFVELFGHLFTNAQFNLFIGKCLATGAAMVWNFILYKKFVYKNDQ